MWVLVVISLQASIYDPEVISTGFYDTMIRCFEQREMVVNRIDMTATQAICIKVKVEKNNVGE